MKKLRKFLVMVLCLCTLAGIMMPAASATTTLTIINLTLDAPVAGRKPTSTASVPSHARSAVKKVEWSGKLNSDGTFMAGVKYKVTVTLGIKKGEDCKFSDKSITAKVNTKLADDVLWYAEDKVEVIYTFPKLAEAKAPTVLKEAEITLTAPEAGKAPATTAKVPSSASYTVKKVEWSGSLSSGKFKENTGYTAYVTLGIKSGKNASFSDQTFDAYVNDYLIDEVIWNSATEIVVPVEFEKTGAAPASQTKLNKIRLTIDAPEAMKKPAATASLPSNARSTVQKVEWSGQLDTDGTFMSRTKYTVTVTLGIKAGSNCIFSDKSINATVNGKEADKVLWYADDKVQVIYTFPEFGTGNTVNTAHITMDEPAVGEKPADAAHIPAASSTQVTAIRWEGALDSNGRFKAGTEYTAYLTVKIKDEFKDRKFSTKSFDAYVNNYLIDEVIWVSDTELVVPVEFEKTGAAASNPPANPGTTGGSVTVNKVAVTIAEPQAGKALPTEAKVTSPNGAAVTKVRWTGDLDNGMPKPGGKGSATITIEAQPGSGITFAGWGEMEVTVNGQKTNMLTDKETRLDVIANFTFPAAAVPPAGSGAVGGFSDVAEKDYFAQPVAWAVQNKITSGTSATTFSPNENCTQAQILTFLWRATGSPEPKGTMATEGFSGTEYYYKAALWAAERGMIGEGNFDPNAPCTRAMAVTFMWNYAGSPAVAPASFTDVSSSADYAQAVAWAVEQNVTAGIGGNQFGPAQTCTRGQIVTFLYRAFAK